MVDASAFRGREAELTGLLRVTEGEGTAALWLRADGPTGKIAFQNTGHRPVRSADGAQTRTIRLYIPLSAQRLMLGAFLEGTGSIEARSLRLQTLTEAQSHVSAYQVLDAAIKVVQGNALYSNRIAWVAEKERLLTPDLHRAPAQEAHARISELLDGLGDRHSFLQPPAVAAEYYAGAIATHPIDRHVSDGIGLVRVPGLLGAHAEAVRKFSVELCDALVNTSPKVSYGWIVDLRRNGGGNMWPMIAGLRPLLGSGAIGAFKNSAGTVSAWEPGVVDGCSTDLSSLPVAVLVGPATASSGEAVAVAFKGRANTRFFGSPTRGLSTANRPFLLPDGTMLNLTTAVFVDRTGTTYDSGVSPDVRLSKEEDPIAAAREWLRSEAG